MLGSFVLMMIGIVIAGPWLTGALARALAIRARRASTLLAARHLADHPTAAFRAVSGVVLAIFVGTTFSSLSPAVLQAAPVGTPGRLRADVLAATPNTVAPAAVNRLIDQLRVVAGVRAVTAIRSATGDPRLPGRQDSRSGVDTSAIASCAAVRSVVAITPPACPGPNGRTAIPVDQRRGDLGGIASLIEPSTRPAAEVAHHPVLYLAVLTNGAGPTIETVRTMIDRTDPYGTNPRTTVEINAVRVHQVTQLQRMVDVGMLLTLLVGGCSLAVGVAGGVIERRRPFALLRLSGIRLRDLRATVLYEAALPLLAVALVSVVLGLLAAHFIISFGGGKAVWPSADPALTLSAGILGAMLITTATLPLLSRLTAPDQPAARFE